MCFCFCSSAWEHGRAHFRSGQHPLAALGSVVTLLIVNQPSAEALQEAAWWEWPRVWIEATSVFGSSWVGFITLIGIVSRKAS